MTSTLDAGTSRRSLLRGGGALVMAFSMTSHALGQGGQLQKTEGTKDEVKVPPLPGSLKETPLLDSWIRIAADGSITVMTGKCELGQGAKTALIQIAAEQLMVDMKQVALITADTRSTPNEGFTAGSHTMQDSGTAILNAAAQVRELLIDMAARNLQVPREELRAEAGAIVGNGGQRAAYRDLVAGVDLHVQAQPTSRLVEPERHRYMGKAIQRIDIPPKVTGGAAYVQDMRMDGMVHARVVRPPSRGAMLTAVDTTTIEKLPGVLKVVRDGNYLAVIALGEYQAIKAARSLTATARWTESASLLKPGDIFGRLRSSQAEDRIPWQKGSEQPVAGGRRLAARFQRDYQQHVSIGPSCAVALFTQGRLTVWSHAQGMYPLRQGLAQLFGMPPDSIDCIHAEGSGCYGHNGADDAAADAAILARAYPDRPVRVQYMREDENIWEPKGSAMIVEAAASLDDAGRIADWRYEVWSNTHSSRPPGAGQLTPSWFLAKPFQVDVSKPIPLPEGDGDRNSQPLYAFPNGRVVYHFVKDAPIRVSALRGLGAYMNVFCLESFMDELAHAANVDPVEFRLRHLEDERAKHVIQLAAKEFGWDPRRKRTAGVGHGFAFARYKNLGAYAAVACELSVNAETGRVQLRRFDAAVDSGSAINPDGIRNQIEGGIIQSSSWTLVESVAHDEQRILARDWSTYPILRFHSVPDTVRIHVVDRPEQPFLGTGEATQGPTAAAIANAIEDAIGVRLRHLPLTPERIRQAYSQKLAMKAT